MRRLLSMSYLSGGTLLVALGIVTGAWFHTATAACATVAVAFTSRVPVATPRVALASTGETILFSNTTARPLHLRSTPHAPAAFALTVPAGATERLTLAVPGLYHYYDTNTAHVIGYQAETDVVHTLPGAPIPDLPDQGWIVVPGPGGVPFDATVHVPAGNDLMAPHATAVRVGGSVILHNHDTDAHNLVTDPADPTGAAFELLGTDGEPTIGGAERRLTFSAPGLYHVYCSIHTRIVGEVGGWKVVVPRDSNASGYSTDNSMEAWILVVQ